MERLFGRSSRQTPTKTPTSPPVMLPHSVHPVRPRLWLLAFASLAPAALGQQVATDTKSGSKVVENEVVELSPFVVASESDEGYVASNTLAGSRLNTSLRDVASPLEVFTKDFLDDIGATSIADAILYHSNAQEDLGDENSAMQQDYKAQAQLPNRFIVRGQQQTLSQHQISETKCRSSTFSEGRRRRRI